MSGSGAGPAVQVFADGGSRGNPGPAGYGAVVLSADGSTVLAERAEFLGRVTNNVAEYSGLIAGLTAAAEIGAREVAVRMDSKLVVEQMSGRWQVKHPDMKPLSRQAFERVREFERVTFEWIPRARNSHADRLANEAMDAGIDGRQWQPPADPAVSDPAQASAALGQVVAARAPATTVVLVRHGETTWGAQRRFVGRTDVELTDLGREQAVAVAGRIEPLAPSAVYSSPLRRCRDTATAIAAVCAPGGTQVRISAGLVDGGLGDWVGCTADEIAGRWPGEYAAWKSDPDAAPPGGESFRQIHRRSVAVLDRVLADHPGEAIVLVTHSAVVKMLLAHALGGPLRVGYRLRVDNASYSVASFPVPPVGPGVGEQATGGDPMLLTMNETGHLPTPFGSVSDRR